VQRQGQQAGLGHSGVGGRYGLQVGVAVCVRDWTVVKCCGRLFYNA
jgi:hypothetical protein